jgi:hypothetical protein
MTRIHRHSIAAVSAAVVAVAVAGCDNSKLTSVNNNPNAPTSAPASAVFTNAVQSAAGNWLGAGYDLRDISLLIQHFAENQYIANDQYKGVGSGSQSGLFASVYQNDLEDFQVVVRSGEASKSPAIYAPALIMQQWEFGYLTDSWGDVPYSQALAGDSATAVLNPAYDPQQQIYTGMFAKLTSAATALGTASGANLGAADPIYNGSTVEWQKFANSLHARDAMRIVNADAATANKELAAAFGGPGGVFTSNADNAQLNWPGGGVFDNPWAVNFASRDDDRMSKTLIDTLNHYNDPRVPIYAMPDAATGVYAGQPNGLSNAQAVAYSDSSSRPGARFYYPTDQYCTVNVQCGPGATQPSYLMTYAELALIQAEAAERGMGGLNASQAAGFYNAGITASMNQWGVSGGAAAAYLTQPQVVYKGGVAGLKQIALQKWIALYGDGGQAWFEWRRTCTPSLVLAAIHMFSYVPRRLLYPTAEKSTNQAQISAAVTRMGGDANNTMMWQDQPANAPTCQ